MDPRHLPRTTTEEPPEALESYLRHRDVPCPRCGYNLRALAIPRCPECGVELRLASAARNQEPGGGSAWHTWGVAQLCFVFVLCALIAFGQVMKGSTTAFLHGLCTVISLAILATWIGRRPRYEGLPFRERWKRCALFAAAAYLLLAIVCTI